MLALTAIVFTAAAIVSPLNIGLRHLSVPIAILIVLIAPLALRPRRAARALAAILAASCVLSAALAAPNYLAYFNFFRGHRPKYQIAGDRNLDWAQYLWTLDDFLRAHQVHDVALDSEGTIDPAPYIGPFQRWLCQTDQLPPGGGGVVTARRMADRAVPFSDCGWIFSYPHWSLGGGAAYVFEATRTPARAKAGAGG